MRVFLMAVGMVACAAPALAQSPDMGSAAAGQQAATPFLRDVAQKGQPEFLRSVAERYGLPAYGGGAVDPRTAGAVSTLDPYAPFTYSGNGVIRFGTPEGPPPEADQAGGAEMGGVPLPPTAGAPLQAAGGAPLAMGGAGYAFGPPQ